MHFEIAEKYSVAEIQRYLQVGNAGGIRVSLDGKRQVQRVALLTAKPTAKVERENPYHDRIEGDVLVYAAAGLHGDQSLGGVNQRIATQVSSHFPIYGFRLSENRRKTGIRRWEFIGLLQFLRVYPDTQIDRQGLVRKVWLFELRICAECTKVSIADERALTASIFANHKFDAEQEVRAEGERISEPDLDLRENAVAVERVRAKIFALDPRGFELLVQSTLQRTGFIEVNVTRYTQDSGIDVNARVSPVHWPIAGVLVQVQAKRWLHTVGRREVAELRGSLDPFAQGAVVTTSYFSRAAVLEAKAVGRQPIVLMDGFHFALKVMSHGLITP